MDRLIEILTTIDGYAWGPVTIILLLGTGVFLALRLGFPQIRRFFHAVGLISGRYDNPDDEGALTHFQALAAALSATIGTGNIAGVATAIAAGGPGAVFWMWLTGLFGMGIKYTECMLGHHYRVINEDGTASGGPMYYLERGLGQKWLGVLFAFFALVASFGIGDMVQANSVAKPIADLGFPAWATGLVLAILVGLVIIGGIRRIGRVAAKVVPLMCIIYVAGALMILFLYIDQIPAAFALIFNSAFTGTAAAGGFLGAGMRQVIQQGVAKGIFSNESGLGSAPIAHAAAKTKEPVREGLVAMVGPFIDTLLICTMTALVIICTGQWNSGLTSSLLSTSAFTVGLGQFGGWIVTFGLVFFAFSTMISWSYYGDRCAEYLFGKKAIIPYRWVFVLVIPLGAYIKIDLVWLLSDIFNAFMAFPNLIGILFLSPVVYKLSKDYFSREHKPVQQKTTIFRQFWKMTGE